MSVRPAPRIVAGVSGLALAVLAVACHGSPPDPEAIVERAIRVHAMEALEQARVSFDLRGERFVLTRMDGWFRQERIYREGEARVRDVMTNESTVREVGGVPVPLTPEERAAAETALNSVVYFAFLPLRLQDSATRPRYAGKETLDGEPYHRVEVTFAPEGGGRDWEDRYVYWFHREEGTLDYLAYRFHVGAGGTRFRRAMNRRTVAGIVIQDYENLVDRSLEDIAEYGRAFEEGRTERLSEIVLENVSLGLPPEGFPHDSEAPSRQRGPREGEGTIGSRSEESRIAR